MQETSEPGAPPPEDVLTQDGATLYSGSWAPRGDDTPDRAPPPADGRYEDLGLIGRGGMGEVRRVRDTVLRRTLAMKLIRAEHQDRVDLRRRFLAEARLTAALQHPGVVPVHDVGVSADGRVWYTMKEVRGRTLAYELATFHGAGGQELGLRRLVDALRRLCEVMAYAHAQGVIHRDLKPANVMIGAFGEVQVMDWGLARLVGEAGEDSGAISGALEDKGQTRLGQVVGTPGYLSPEQARGELADLSPASDVFALGLMLFELLQGERPYVGEPESLVEQAARSAPPPVRPRVQGRGVRELVELCHRALAFAPEARPAHAGVLVTELAAWLEGARLAARAEALTEAARPLAAQALDLRRAAQEAETAATQALSALAPRATPEHKAPAWARQDEAARLRREAAAADAQRETALRSALELSPGHGAARRALVALYLEQLERAEILRNVDGIERLEQLVRGLDPAGAATWLADDASMSLRTEPPAEVLLCTLEAHGRRVVPVERGALGRTPLLRVTVPRGPLLLRVQAAGCPPVTLTLCPRRSAHVGFGPDEDPDATLDLPRALAPGERWVGAGWFQAGGGLDAIDAYNPTPRWLPSFVIREHPVTCAEYLDFLNDLVDQGRAVEAAAHAPKDQHKKGQGAEALFRLDDAGRYALSRGERPTHPRWPINLVTWHAAQAYAAWEAARSGLPWRLPSELEWEKAARGADGRAFPWGDHYEPAWACGQSSHAGQPWWVPVDDFPDDVSPYGVRGMAGNVRDWCADPYRKGGAAAAPDAPATETPSYPQGMAMIRGGCWTSSARACEAASRFAGPLDSGWTSVGFRLARSWPS